MGCIMSKALKEYEKVSDYIIELIRTGKLEIGSKLPPERMLANELGISRNSTREALRNLENMGIIECRQGSGSYVTCEISKVLSSMLSVMFSLENITIVELNEFRKAIDKMVCAMLIDRYEDLTWLIEEATELLDKEVESQDEESDIDNQFHFMLIDATKNKLLITMTHSVAQLYHKVIDSVLTVAGEERKKGFREAHKGMLYALKQGSKAMCDEAVELHYKRVEDIVQKSKLDEHVQSSQVRADAMRSLTRLEANTQRDYLTGLYLKDVFFDKVDKYIKAHPDEDLILWACDVRGLRFINEKHGMDMGDRILQIVANMGSKLENYLFGGRIDGDKFCALMHDSHEDYGQKNRELAQSYSTEYPIKNVSIKNGIYHIKKNDSLSPQAMYVRAVLALQSIKDSYTEMVKEYDDKMREELLVTRQIVEDADSAIDRNEFQIYYQPKISVVDDKVSGAEALVRWIHPELGYLHPGLFIDLFEKNGFITKLDYYIWEEVCKTLVEWKKKGYKIVNVSVNVSKKSFEDEKLAEKIIELVDRYELSHELFEIEITEYSCLGNMDMIQNTIKKLHEAGFIIALDDFGTGYSSMIVLSRMHLDILKLDMSLIKNDKIDAKINALEFAMQLAHMMNLRTVAEGIETEEQVERIRSLGADYIQGYYYSKPVPKDEFERDNLCMEHME